jgi:hypothetical protein
VYLASGKGGREGGRREREGEGGREGGRERENEEITKCLPSQCQSSEGRMYFKKNMFYEEYMYFSRASLARISLSVYLSVYTYFDFGNEGYQRRGALRKQRFTRRCPDRR